MLLKEYLQGCCYMQGRTHYCVKVAPALHHLNQKCKNEAWVIDFFSGIVIERIVDIS